MDTLFGFIIILMLLYIIDILKKEKTIKTEKSDSKDKKFSYTDVLSQYKGKKCEIIVKRPMLGIDAVFNIQGTIVDWDNNWIVMRTESKKTVSKKIFRTDNISSVKEIIE